MSSILNTTAVWSLSIALRLHSLARMSSRDEEGKDMNLRLLTFLTVLALVAAAGAEQIVSFKNDEYGLTLRYPESMGRQTQYEQNGVICALTYHKELYPGRGSPSIMISGRRLKPGYEGAAVATEVLKTDEQGRAQNASAPKNVYVGNKKFFRQDYQKTSAKGNVSDRSLYTHYDPKTGVLITLKVSMQAGSPNEVDKAFDQVINTIRF